MIDHHLWARPDAVRGIHDDADGYPIPRWFEAGWPASGRLPSRSGFWSAAPLRSPPRPAPPVRQLRPVHASPEPRPTRAPRPASKRPLVSRARRCWSSAPVQPSSPAVIPGRLNSRSPGRLERPSASPSARTEFHGWRPPKSIGVTSLSFPRSPPCQAEPYKLRLAVTGLDGSTVQATPITALVGAVTRGPEAALRLREPGRPGDGRP